MVYLEVGPHINRVEVLHCVVQLQNVRPTHIRAENVRIYRGGSAIESAIRSAVDLPLDVGSAVGSVMQDPNEDLTYLP